MMGNDDRRQGDTVAWWSLPVGELAQQLGTTRAGLTAPEAEARLRRFGPNRLGTRTGRSTLGLILRQVESPVVVILLGAAIAAMMLGDALDAGIVLVIVVASAVLGFVQEYRASNVLARLVARLQPTAIALRDGVPMTVPRDAVVPGDVVVLAAGDLVPADGVLLEGKDLYVVEAALTGEPEPVCKEIAPSPRDAPLAARTNALFMGTSVRSGTGRMLVVATGPRTVFGGIGARLRLRPPETDFERGIRRYGYLLSQLMLALVLVVFAANVFLEKPPIDSLLFAIALAVGLSPELLPAIVGVTLARGAHEMAKGGVVVRRLSSIENLGSMDVLCTDKTGTLTEGVMRLDGALDPTGAASTDVLRWAYLNAAFETGIANPLDEALVEAGRAAGLTTDGFVKLDEVPYDFTRRRLSIVVRPAGGEPLLLTKGAFTGLLERCDRVLCEGEPVPLGDPLRAEITRHFEDRSREGLRVLALAVTPVAPQPSYAAADERDLVFAGLLLFRDRPKVGIDRTLAGLAERGVAVKVVSGDNRLVTAHLAGQVGLDPEAILTGAAIASMPEEALLRAVGTIDVFAEVEPGQKERIILALKKAGHVTGFLGDGINDAAALHAADVGISVDRAVDVAREAADLVLLQPDLDVLGKGIDEGRRTFVNTLNYLTITTSANVGNMLSMAVASLALPFLPLLAKQILLNNLLSDVPMLAIAGDRPDAERIANPQRWNLQALRRRSIVLGGVSSAFDLLTFVVLLMAFRAGPETFRTAWFVESLLTEIVVIFVLRTALPFWRSRPTAPLLLGAIGVAAVALVLPYLPGSGELGFVPLSAAVLATVVGLALLYALATETAKRRVA